MLCHLNKFGAWPRVTEVFYGGEAKDKIVILPMDQITADQWWKTG
jgi:hypothetical protein